MRPDRREGVQVVLAPTPRPRLDVRALAREEPARRVHALASVREHPRSPGAGPASRSAGRGGGRATRRRSRRRAGRGRARSRRRRTARDGAGCARASGPAHRRRRGEGVGEPGDEQGEPHGVAQRQPVPRAGHGDEGAAGQLRHPDPARRTARSRRGRRAPPAPGTHTARHTASASALPSRARAADVASRVAASVCSAQPTPSSRCLVECGSGNIRAKNNSAHPRWSTRQDVARRIPVTGLVADLRRSVRRARRHYGHRGRGRHHAGDPAGMSGRELQRMAGAQRQPHEHSPLDAGRVHGRDGVGDVLLVRVGRRADRPVRGAVAPALDGHHPEPPGQRRAPAASTARMWMTAHDVRNTSVGRPVPQQRLEHLVADPDAVALDDATVRARVRLPRARTLRADLVHVVRTASRAARRNRVNPASVATCRMAASPAWAPRL